MGRGRVALLGGRHLSEEMCRIMILIQTLKYSGKENNYDRLLPCRMTILIQLLNTMGRPHSSVGRAPDS